MGKGIALFRAVLISLLYHCGGNAFAASCIDVFPDSDTEDSSITLEVPTWSSSTHIIQSGGSDSYDPGDHYFASGQLSGGYQLDSTGVSARLYFTSLTISSGVEINSTGEPENVIIIVDGPVSISGNPDINAIIYATGAVTVSGNFDIRGAITSESSVAINGSNSVTYDSDAIANGDFGTLCSNVPDEVAYWSFDTIADQTVPDDSGNGHDGTLGAGNSVDSDEPVGMCNQYLEYDGADDYVNVPDDADLDITEALTVAAWIRPEKIPSSGLMTIVSKDTNFEFHVNSSGNINWWWNNSSGTQRQFNSIGSVSVDEWIHVAVVYSKSAGTQTIYLDGVPSGTENYSEDLRVNSNPLQIGNDQGYSGRYFQGDIDEVYVFNQALTQTHIQEIMASSPSFCAQDEALVSYIFDGETWNGSAGEVVDNTGNGVDGYAVGGAQTSDLLTAINTNPGTCDYGEFDGSGDYLRTDNSSTDLQLSDSYSTAIWVNASASQSDGAGIYNQIGQRCIFFFCYDVTFWGLNIKRSGLTDRVVVTHDPFNLNIGDQDWNTGITLSDIDDGWHHIAIVRDTSGAGTEMISYLDGVEINSAFSFTADTTTGSSHLRMGRSVSDIDFSGSLDELSIYDQVLSASEIQDIMNTTRPCAIDPGCTSVDLLDNFSSSNYNNSDGNTDWTSNRWVEVNDDDSPSGGRVRITGGELEIRGGGGAQRQIYRAMDIADQDEATLQFDIRETNAESGDELDLHIYDGSSWVLLETFDGDVSDSTQTYDITAYISSDTRVRFTEDSNNGNDRFYVDDLSVSGSCASNVDHLEISAASTGSTCEPLVVTVRACEDSANPCTTLVDNYEESINLTISPSKGDWSNNDGQGTLTDTTGDDGAAAYQFHSDDNGDVSLNLSYIYADAIKITATDNANSLSVESSVITFSDNAFVLNWDDTGSSNTVAIAGRDHGLTATYIRKDSSTGACGTVTTYDGDMALLVWFNDNGAYSSVPNAPGLKDETDLSSVTLPAAQPVSSNIDVHFTEGVADLSMTSTDVGQFTVSILDNSGFVVDENNNPLDVTGESALATVEPFGFSLDVHETSTAVDCATSGTRASASTGASYAVDSSGSVYKRAGEQFKLVVRAVLWDSSDDDSPVDGLPDSDADFYDNGCTVSFGNENTRETVTVSLNNSLPSGGSTGLLGGSSSYVVNSFSSGVGEVNTDYDEVGIVSLTGNLTSSNYLSVGSRPSGSLNNFGRFIPNNFAVSPDPTTPILDDATGWACDFTYQGQNFQFESDIELSVTAYEAGGDVVENYGGEGTSEDYFKLTALTPQNVSSLSVSDNVVGMNSTLAFDQSTSIAPITNAADYDGVATITFSGFLLAYQRAANTANGAGDIPFDADIDWVLDDGELTDSDAACLSTQVAPLSCLDYTIANIVGTEIRYGRVEVGNNNGSELMNLELPVQVQQWMETSSSSALYSFLVNNEDVCSTSWVAGDITLNSYQGNLASGETTGTLGTFSSGIGVIHLSAPGTGNEGSVNAVLGVDDWLKYDFYGRGNEDPTGTGTFGIYSGRQPIFYLRESYR